MYPRDRSGPTDEDDAVDYTVLAYAAVDGVSRAQLMGQAFRSLSVEEKERSLGRLTRAGLASADDERVWRTSAGHAAMARITATGERRGWDVYKRWVGAALYPNAAVRARSHERSSPDGQVDDRPER